MRERARIRSDIPSEIVLEDGTRMHAVTSDISLSGARLVLDRPLGVADEARCRIAFHTGGEVQEVPATLLRWEENEAVVRFEVADLRDEMALVRVFFGRPDAWIAWDDWPRDKPLRALKDVVGATRDAVFHRYRFQMRKPPKRLPPAAMAAAAVERKSDVVRPRRLAERAKDMAAGLVLALALGLAGPALAQNPPPQGQTQGQGQTQRPAARPQPAPPPAPPATVRMAPLAPTLGAAPLVLDAPPLPEPEPAPPAPVPPRAAPIPPPIAASPFIASRSTRAPSAEHGSSDSGTSDPYCREPRRPSA